MMKTFRVPTIEDIGQVVGCCDDSFEVACSYSYVPSAAVYELRGIVDDVFITRVKGGNDKDWTYETYRFAAIEIKPIIDGPGWYETNFGHTIIILHKSEAHVDNAVGWVWNGLVFFGITFRSYTHWYPNGQHLNGTLELNIARKIEPREFM